MFPIEIHWGAKSGSVERILKAWNIGADAVVFVDDSPLELAEVGATFPQVECLLFPKDDESQALAVLEHLRDRSGKPRLSEEDVLRRESLVKAVQFGEMSAETAPDEFLASLEATVTLDLTAADNDRVFELINKTNQFNLNGERYDTVSWQQAAARPCAFAWSVAYHDKFGPLGKIAAVSGFRRDNVVHVDTWVMSCRAFARRIEYQVLKQLFAWAPDADLEFQFRATERNGPVQELLSKFCETLPQTGTIKVTSAAFQAACPPLFHTVRIAAET